MVKALAGSALAFTVFFGVGLAAVACSGSSESTFAAEPPKPDVDDGPGSLLPDGGGLGDGSEAGPASCPPAMPATFAPTWTPPTTAAACSVGELKMYYDACLADPGKTEPDGTCKTFKTDHAACGACAEPTDKSGPVQWQLGRKFFTINVAGCISVAQNAPEPGKCGAAYNAAVQCSRQSCESCFAIGGTIDQFHACQAVAQQTALCKTYENAEATACTGYKNPGAPALACFNNGETQEVHFMRVVGLICGK